MAEPDHSHHGGRHHKHRLTSAEWFAFTALAVAGGAVVLYTLQGTPELPHVKLVGCFKSDESFSQDKALGFNAAESSTVGANLALAFDQAKMSSKRYFAVAREHDDEGYSVAFDALSSKPDAQGGGCDRVCDDFGDYKCGCAGVGCGHSADASTRRWIVYENLEVSAPRKKAPPAPRPKARFVGCYKAEDTFGPGRKYGGDTIGANVGQGLAHARSHGKRFFALASGGEAGHAFAIDEPATPPDAGTAACGLPCSDAPEFVCGCIDAACGLEAPEPGQEHIRRWAVYEAK